MATCPICDDDFASETSCRSHARDAHTGCSYCGETFDDTDALYTHWLSTHDDLPKRARQEAIDAVGEPSTELPGGISRRQVLGGAAALGLGAAGFAGAASVLTSSDDPQPLADHPAAQNIEAQPTLGPAPTDASATIIAFEDPSCTSCARFEQNVFPQLRQQHIDTGAVSFVYRGVPFVYPWGQQGVRVLEAVYEQQPAAFEAVKAGYYDRQGRFTSNNVLDETAQMLNDLDVDIDSNAVIDAVEANETEQAVQADVDAARAAGVRATPTFFLFADGTYQTQVVGPQRLSVFENALNL